MANREIDNLRIFFNFLILKPIAESESRREQRMAAGK